MDLDAEKHSQMPVAMAFESYLIAGISEWKIAYLARSLQDQMESETKNEKETILENAKMEAKAKVEAAETKLESSRTQNNPFREAPLIYPLWLQMRMFERSLKDARKFVVVVKNAEITSDIDLKETIRRGMLEVDVPDNK